MLDQLTDPLLSPDQNRSLSERPRPIDQLAAGKPSVHDYADLQGESLLKTTLG